MRLRQIQVVRTLPKVAKRVIVLFTTEIHRKLNTEESVAKILSKSRNGVYSLRSEKITYLVLTTGVYQLKTFKPYKMSLEDKHPRYRDMAPILKLLNNSIVPMSKEQRRLLVLNINFEKGRKHKLHTCKIQGKIK